MADPDRDTAPNLDPVRNPDPAGSPDTIPEPGGHHDEIGRFVRRCQHRLEVVAATAKAEEGTAALASALDHAEPRSFEPSWLPVLDSTERLIDLTATDERDHQLVDDFLSIVPLLPWTPTHRATDGGTDLALAPLDRVFDLGDTVVGLMYVGPQATYPLHHHPPQELYLTIAGQGRWRYGGNDDFERVPSGRALYNHPGDLHSSIAGAVPVVALYVLW